MVEIHLEESDRLDWALKAFKRKIAKAGILKDLRKKRYYVKPSEARQLKAAAARRRSPGLQTGSPAPQNSPPEKKTGSNGAMTARSTAPAWLQYAWNSAGGNTNPAGIAAFGVFSGQASRVYQREVY